MSYNASLHFLFDKTKALPDHGIFSFSSVLVVYCQAMVHEVAEVNLCMHVLVDVPKSIHTLGRFAESRKITGTV